MRYQVVVTARGSDGASGEVAEFEALSAEDAEDRAYEQYDILTFKVDAVSPVEVP
jgi:hypothetical protein